ncbi:MAG: starch synthase [Gammaproteobacteria bacterium]|jgi:starch synthase
MSSDKIDRNKKQLASKGKSNKKLNNRILFAASELYPFIKTGGLADVACFLPLALRELGYDIRIVIPAYQSILDQDLIIKKETEFIVPETDNQIRVLETTLSNNFTPVYLVDAPGFFDRSGTPYQSPDHEDWPDNHLRFALFCRVIRQICQNKAGLDWTPELLHCNDWHTGLAPALLSQDPQHPPCIFGIHNLAYQGVYPGEAFTTLSLPEIFNTPDALEYYGSLSFIKGGLVFADKLVTVSPRYSEEITTKEYGNGLDGLLSFRRDDLSGILNGVDYELWDPNSDPLIAQKYSLKYLGGKEVNKQFLQSKLTLENNSDAILLAYIGRLTDQKGCDLILNSLHHLFEDANVQLVILGQGDPEHEKSFRKATISYPDNMKVVFDFDETLAHQIQASADILLMPSRFEPCGLTQLYSLRYGTIPIVHHTGGLADTIVNTTEISLKNQTATGFQFYTDSSSDFLDTVERAIRLYESSKSSWRQIMRTAMQQQFSWEDSAMQYSQVYQDLLSPQ